MDYFQENYKAGEYIYLLLLADIQLVFAISWYNWHLQIGWQMSHTIDWYVCINASGKALCFW